MIFLLSALVFFAVFYSAARILEKILRRGYCQRLLANPAAYGTALPERLALAVLPRGRVFRSLTLPIPGKDGQEIQLGTVVVSRSGIFILCQINGGGILENNPSGKWKHICGGKFSEFDNPFTVQGDARTLIDYYAERAGEPEIKAHSMVLYTNSSLRFVNQRSRSVICTSDFVSRLLFLEKRGRLSKAQIKTACSILKEADAY